jgi:hypothetical protein
VARLLERALDIDRQHCPNCCVDIELIAAIPQLPVSWMILAHLAYLCFALGRWLPQAARHHTTQGQSESAAESAALVSFRWPADPGPHGGARANTRSLEPPQRAPDCHPVAAHEPRGRVAVAQPLFAAKFFRRDNH